MKHSTSRAALERVLVLAPTETDAALCRRVLTEAKISCEICDDLNHLIRGLEIGVGAVLLTEAALGTEGGTHLEATLSGQPPWSDVPILLLAGQGADSPIANTAMRRLGNVTVLEQPVRITTLVSALRTALRARWRQYELRDRLEALRQSEARLRMSLTAARIVAWEWDPATGRIHHSSEAAEVLGSFGLDPLPEYMARVRPEDAPVLQAEMEKASAEGSEFTLTVRYTRPDNGELLWLEIRGAGQRESNKWRNRVIGVTLDITARKTAEESLRKSEARFRFLSDTMPSIMWTADPDGTITYANRQWLEFCGLDSGETSSTWPELVVHPDDRQRCQMKWDEALHNGCEYAIEVRNRRHDGEYRWFVTRAVPLKDFSGKILSWFGVTTDIHDQKLLEEKLRESDRRKDEFLATLAHELRNPLAPIQNSLRILQIAGDDAAARDEVIEMMARQVRHLVRLVDDLLEVSRISRGKLELRMEVVDMAEIVAAAVEASRPAIDASRHELAVELPQQSVALEVDPIRITQVIANLLNNAAKYTHEGGRIWLRVRQDGDDVELSVRDTGVGIPVEMLPKVFDLFTQVDSSPGRSQGGLGIGLTLVKSLIQMHGGTVEARSEGPNRGSEFTIHLPAASRQLVSRSPVISPLPAVGGAACRILLVDDNVDAAASLGKLLQLLGHDVRLAHEGKSAIDTARRYHPDVVVLDIGMPGFDGYEVAKQLRREPGFDHTRLIALTGYGQEEDRRRSLGAGFDVHLVKPVDMAALQELLGPAEEPPAMESQ